MKSICIFCGSSKGKGTDYLQAAQHLAEAMADRGLDLIYGGANIGIMGILADTLLNRGQHVTGIMPGMLAQKEIAHTGLSKMHLVQTMAERKTLMGELADAFIALPGGIGTLDELAEVMTWFQLDITDKPLAILNTNGYFDALIQFLDHAVEQKFLRPEHRANLIIENQAGPLLDQLLSFCPTPIDSKWVDELKIQ